MNLKNIIINNILRIIIFVSYILTSIKLIIFKKKKYVMPEIDDIIIIESEFYIHEIDINAPMGSEWIVLSVNSLLPYYDDYSIYVMDMKFKESGITLADILSKSGNVIKFSFNDTKKHWSTKSEIRNNKLEDLGI